MTDRPGQGDYVRIASLVTPILLSRPAAALGAPCGRPSATEQEVSS